MWFKICGGALLLVVAILLIKTAGGMTLPLQWTGHILLVGASLVMLTPVLAWVSDVCGQAGVGEHATLLFKGLGVALLTQLCADFCRQGGEGQLAGGVELAGKAELLLLCLPSLRQLFELVANMLMGA
jgi:stage III sporulation protein AD